MGAALPILWLDDGLVEHPSARVSPFDHGLTVGDGVFETLKVVGADAFAVSRHLRRLRHSAEAMSLAVPADATLRSAIAAVLAANPTATKIRVMVTSGEGRAGSGRGDGPVTLVVFADDAPLATGAARLALVPWTRNEGGALAGIKSTSYAENVLALRRARSVGADEALFANTRREVCEGSGSNVFAVLDGVLTTPPLSSGCLAGITRELVLEITDAVEAPIPVAAIGEVSEWFLTSSTRDVQPVIAIDDHSWPQAPGPRTATAAAAFARAARDLDP
ncbi:MAG: aminotransferase class IV [Acidimicrobiia bacterium]|nr:aminotransferase class IV [Acidimicrobiia bacterium]